MQKKDVAHISHVERLMWYANRPALYLHLARQIRRKIGYVLTGKRYYSQLPAARAWAAERQIDFSTALQRLFGVSLADSWMDIHRNDVTYAKSAIESCPVVMFGGDPEPQGTEFLYQASKYLQATRTIETGVSYGWSTLALLLAFSERAAKLVSVDLPYPGLGSEQYVGCVVPPRLRDHWTLIQSPDRQGLPKALTYLPVIDLCHYDSDKTYEGRMFAYPRLWEALRTGGVFVSDDIEVDFAFRDFCQRIHCEPIVVQLQKRRIGVIVKA